MPTDLMKSSDIFLTSPQAARFLNVSKATLSKLISQKKIRWFKTPGGHFRIHREDLLKIVCQESQVM